MKLPLKSMDYWTPEAEEALVRGCAELGMILSRQQVGTFSRFANLLLRANSQFNLTSITDAREVALKHFVDSLAALRFCDLKEANQLIDIGTGCGIPGIPLKLLMPEAHFTFVEAKRKKLEFVKEACTSLGLEQCSFQWERAEDLAHTQLRGQFDVALVRALGNLPIVCEIGLPFVKVGGKLVAFKGRQFEQELTLTETTCRILGGTIQSVHRFKLPLTDNGRALMLIIKVRATSGKYPRKMALIRKHNLGAS